MRMLEVPDGVTCRRRMPVLRLLFGFPGSVAFVQTFKQAGRRKQTAIVRLSNCEKAEPREGLWWVVPGYR
jgi:hypothetical protein